MRKWLTQVDAGWIIATLLPVIPILASLGDGILLAADSPLHVHRIRAMTFLLADGNWWPRWVPYFHLGFGYPVFNFYPPGVFYLGGLLGLIGIGAASAFVILSVSAWVLGSTGMYALAKTCLPGPAALLAAALWSYAPSRFYEVWFQGSLPQMMSAALVPWLLYGLVRMAFAPSRRTAVLTAVLIAGVILTHIPIAFITALYAAPVSVLVIGWATRHDRRQFFRRAAALGGSVLLGGGLSAIFWLPMVLELHHVGAWSENTDREYFVSYLQETFLMPDSIFAQPIPFDLTDLTLRFPTSLGLAGGLLSLAGLIGLLARKKAALAALLVGGMIFTLFMLTEYSLDVWLSLPFFRQLRYPERFLRLGAILVALLGGAALLLLPQRRQKAGLAGGLVLVIAAALPLNYGHVPHVAMDSLTALDEIDFELQTRVWGTTSYDEFDPNWGETIPRPGEVPDPALYRDHPLRLVVYELDLIQQFPDLKTESVADATIRVTAATERPVRFRQYYYPGWEVTLDGQPVRAYPESEMGLLTVDVPAGEHLLKLHYAGTAAQKAGAALTLLSLGVALLLIVVRRRPTPAAAPWLGGRFALLIAGALVGFALVNKFHIMPDTHWLRYQSPPDQPEYMETEVNQAFGDEFTLLGYTLEQDKVSPGDWLLIDLYWQPQHDVTAPYRPIVQLVNLPLTEAWAVSEPPAISILGMTSRRFFSMAHRLQVYDWSPPYVGRLSVQMVSFDTGEPLRLPDGSDRLLLDPLIRVRGSGRAVANRLGYTLGQVVQLRCASVAQQGDQLVIDLYWHVIDVPPPDLVTFVHGLDDQGVMVQQNDNPPLASSYPSSYWLPGQSLVDRHTLPADPAITSIALGLYSAGVGRLSVTQDGAPVQDDTIRLPLDAVMCSP